MEETPTAPEPIINCAHTALVNPQELKPHPSNPNVHPPKQIELFMAILAYQGWRRPITVSKLSGFVTKGHGALQTALHAGFRAVPVDFQDYPSPEAELADIVADNQLQRMSEMNTGKLKDLLVNLDTGAFNMELSGFEQTKLEKLFTSVGHPPTAPVFNGAEGAPVIDGNAPTSAEAGAPLSNQGSHVRMVQLFFNETTQAEFVQIAEHFQAELGVDNITDCVLEVMRSAYRAHTEKPDEPAEEDRPAMAASEGAMAEPAGPEAQ